MPELHPTRTDSVGFYRLDGRPVVVRPGRNPETHDGQRVDCTEWAQRAVRISRKEYLALVRRTERARWRSAGLRGAPPPGAGRPVRWAH